jgi:hypothetical protein
VRTAQGALDTSSWPAFAELQVDELRKDVVHATIVGGAAAATDPEPPPLDFDAPVRLVWSKR